MFKLIKLSTVNLCLVLYSPFALTNTMPSSVNTSFYPATQAAKLFQTRTVSSDSWRSHRGSGYHSGYGGNNYRGNINMGGRRHHRGHRHHRHHWRASRHYRSSRPLWPGSFIGVHFGNRNWVWFSGSIPVSADVMQYRNGKPVYRCLGVYRGRQYVGSMMKGSPCYIRVRGRRIATHNYYL